MEWRTEPDPQMLLELASSVDIKDADIVEVGMSIPELKDFSDINISPFVEELVEMLQYFHMIYEEINRKYADEYILFAGRDSRLLYVFSKTLASLQGKNQNRFIQIPGSRDFYASERNRNLEIRLLESFHITKKHLDADSRYVFVDTGFEGSVGISFREFVRQTLVTTKDLSEQIPIMLVSSYTDNPTVGQFTDLGQAKGEIGKKLKEYVRYKRERGSTDYLYTEKFSRVNDYLAIFLQNVPQYHGAYNETMEYQGEVIAVSAGRGALVKEPFFYVINADFISPVAALRLDLELVRQILKGTVD